MINLKHYREQPQIYIKGAADKGHTIDWKQFDELDAQVRTLKHEIDKLNALRNELSKSIQTIEKGSDEFKDVVSQVQAMKGELAEKEEGYQQAYAAFHAILLSIPSPALEEVPV